MRSIINQPLAPAIKLDDPGSQVNFKNGRLACPSITSPGVHLSLCLPFQLGPEQAQHANTCRCCRAKLISCCEFASLLAQARSKALPEPFIESTPRKGGVGRFMWDNMLAVCHHGV